MWPDDVYIIVREAAVVWLKVRRQRGVCSRQSAQSNSQLFDQYVSVSQSPLTTPTVASYAQLARGDV